MKLVAVQQKVKVGICPHRKLRSTCASLQSDKEHSGSVVVLDLRLKGCRLEPHRRHCVVSLSKVRKRAKIRNRYNQAPHLTRDTNWKVTASQLDFTHESQKVSINHCLVLVQPRKTHPDMTEKMLIEM